MAIGAHQVDPLEAVNAGRAVMSGHPDAALRCQRIFGLVR